MISQNVSVVIVSDRDVFDLEIVCPSDILMHRIVVPKCFNFLKSLQTSVEFEPFFIFYDLSVCHAPL